MTDDDKVLREYDMAKSAYDAAERNLAVARARLHQAEQARGKWWDKLVSAAEKLTPNARKIVAEKQFGPAMAPAERGGER